jgi:hypothetical protein
MVKRLLHMALAWISNVWAHIDSVFILIILNQS